MSVYKRGKKGTHWHYYFRVRGVRYRGAIPEARTKWEAERAESKIKQDVFEADGEFFKSLWISFEQVAHVLRGHLVMMRRERLPRGGLSQGRHGVSFKRLGICGGTTGQGCVKLLQDVLAVNREQKAVGRKQKAVGS